MRRSMMIEARLARAADSSVSSPAYFLHPMMSMDVRKEDAEESKSRETCAEVAIYYAVGDYEAQDDTQVSLRDGEEVHILEKISSDWWWVEVGNSIGYVPTNHLSESSPHEGVDYWQDEEYFSSYETLKLHLEMLSDRPRTLAYKAAVENAREFIKDKVVLDLGSGTGILSLFCARLGEAKKVYAIEASGIAEQAASVVEHNGLSETIQIIQCKAEDANLPEKVDLIISEWMGTLLLFELMLETVLTTRDRCLKDDGVMWPSEAELFLVPCSAEKTYKEKILFWNDVYGFDFSPMVPLAKTELISRPIYNHILAEEDCLCTASSVMKLYLKTVKLEDIENMESSFKYSITRDGVMHGFGSWFQVKFGDVPSSYNYEPVTLSTSPYQPQTHWRQDLLMLKDPILVQSGDHIKGSIKIIRNEIWRRHLRVFINCTHNRNGELLQEITEEYALWK